VAFNIRHYSIGFVEIVPPDRIALCGSGTLVCLGKVRGILTAAHVWHVVAKLPRVGLYLYPAGRREWHSIREHIALMEPLIFGGEFADELGPDLAFVRLTDQKAAELEAHSTFLNLERNEERGLQPVPEGWMYIDAIAGGVEEFGQKITEHGSGKTIIQEGLINVGFTKRIDDGREGFDRLEFTPEPVQDVALPGSYGGTSGGGCFRMFSQGGPEVLRYQLIGVAYFETRKAGMADKILCHGPVTLRDQLMPAIRKKWLCG
jgi:hypothetical protein